MKTKIFQIIVTLAVSLFLSAGVTLAQDKKGKQHKSHGKAYSYQKNLKANGYHPDWNKKITNHIVMPTDLTAIITDTIIIRGIGIILDGTEIISNHINTGSGPSSLTTNVMIVTNFMIAIVNLTNAMRTVTGSSSACRSMIRLWRY